MPLSPDALSGFLVRQPMPGDAALGLEGQTRTGNLARICLLSDLLRQAGEAVEPVRGLHFILVNHAGRFLTEWGWHYFRWGGLRWTADGLLGEDNETLAMKTAIDILGEPKVRNMGARLAAVDDKRFEFSNLPDIDHLACVQVWKSAFVQWRLSTLPEANPVNHRPRGYL